MENNVYHPLFDFDSIVDTAMSVAMLIKEEYWSDKYFIPLRDERFLKCLFATMPTRDPMSLLVTEKYMDRCDELYDELIADTKLDKYVYLYGIASFVRVLNNVDFTNCTILVKNTRQEKIIRDIFKNDVTILKSSGPIEITGKYGSYYTDNVYNLLSSLIEPKFINFRIMRMKFNMEDKQGFEMFKLSVITQLSTTNTLASINSYPNLIIPKEEES